MNTLKDSVFTTAVRSFCKGFFSIVGISFAIIPVILFFGIIFIKKDVSSTKNTVQILPDLNGNTIPLPEKTPAILQIDIQGIIGIKDLTTKNIDSILIDSKKGILKNNRVKAIFLNVNTRGGAVFDSDGIYRALKEYKKINNIPIFAFVDGINASGGIYITSAADKIYATPVSLIGSVGVVMGPFFNLSKSLEKIGVDSLTITDGKNKDAMNPFRPWNENESQGFKEIGDYYYQRFVNIVTTARPQLSKEKLISTYGAKVFPSPKAEKYGYIDEGNSNYKKALRALLHAANIDETKPYQVLKLKSKKPVIESFFESSLFNGKVKHEINIGNNSKTTDNFSYLYQANHPK